VPVPPGRKGGRALKLTLPGGTVVCDVIGDGPPLLFLNGLGMPRSGWSRIVASLKSPCRAILFDPPGSGESDDPRGPLSIASLADDASRLLEILSVGEAFLVGTSMGGFTALEMARRHRHRTRGMVLFCTPSRLDGWGRFQVETWLRLRREGVSPESLIRLQLAATLSSSLFDRLATVEAMVAFFVDHQEKLGQSDGAFVAQARASLDFDGEPFLGDIDCPALVVAGGEDRMVSPAQAEALHRGLRRSRFLLLPDGGHALAVTESAAMAAAIDSLLAAS
jgi:pimeloyl-ACP methyl ester carboxylesterase